MTLLLTVVIYVLATAVGTVLGNGALLWFIGRKAKEAQQQQVAAVEELQQMLVAEAERMKAYARMES